LNPGEGLQTGGGKSRTGLARPGSSPAASSTGARANRRSPNPAKATRCGPGKPAGILVWRVLHTHHNQNAKACGKRRIGPATNSPYIFQDASILNAYTMAGSQRAEFWPFCVVFIIINDINRLAVFSHDVFETHNNPNETWRLGKILLRASSGR
jgi:hypothetical protein